MKGPARAQNHQSNKRKLHPTFVLAVSYQMEIMALSVYIRSCWRKKIPLTRAQAKVCSLSEHSGRLRKTAWKLKWNL